LLFRFADEEPGVDLYRNRTHAHTHAFSSSTHKPKSTSGNEPKNRYGKATFRQKYNALAKSNATSMTGDNAEAHALFVDVIAFGGSAIIAFQPGRPNLLSSRLSSNSGPLHSIS
jgi:hypothetical protein